MMWSSALQVAVKAKLASQATPVYDEVPPNVQPPYIVIGAMTEVPGPIETHDSDASEETITLHVWSSAKDSTQCKTIMGAIDALLHHGDLTMTGGRVVMMRRDFVEMFKDELEKPGDVWRHGVMRYRTLLSN